MLTLEELRNTLPQIGKLTWLGIRPARRVPMQQRKELLLDPQQGIVGDRYAGRSGARQVTLIQAEHLAVLGSLIPRPTDDITAITPDLLRRNLVVAGINLLGLMNQIVNVGGTRLTITGRCHPCSRMEQILGPGGYNAMRGHGGVTARVIEGGRICVGDEVSLYPTNSLAPEAQH